MPTANPETLTGQETPAVELTLLRIGYGLLLCAVVLLGFATYYMMMWGPNIAPGLLAGGVIGAIYFGTRPLIATLVGNQFSMAPLSQYEVRLKQKISAKRSLWIPLALVAPYLVILLTVLSLTWSRLAFILTEQLMGVFLGAVILGPLVSAIQSFMVYAAIRRE